MKLTTAMAVTKILVKNATGLILDEWGKNGLMFSSKTMAVAFRVISGKSKFPNLVKAFENLRDDHNASTHCIVAFSADQTIEPVVCLKLTTFLRMVIGIGSGSVQKAAMLNAEVINMEYEIGRKLGQV